MMILIGRVDDDDDKAGDDDAMVHIYYISSIIKIFFNRESILPLYF